MLKREALEASPLADLHELASEAGLEGFRRLRKAELIDRLLGGSPAADAEAPSTNGAAASSDDDKPRRTRGGRGRGRGAASQDDDAKDEPVAKADAADEDDDAPRTRPRGRSRRGTGDDAPSGRESTGNGREGRDGGRDSSGSDEDERQIEGVVEVLGNGTAFVRVKHPEQSDDDVYVSAAQVRRCELVSGDKITGPYRQPRRSERYASLIRVEQINGKSAEEVAGEATRFDDQPSTHPTARFELGGDDVTLKAIEWLAPIGRGSRVVLYGPAHAGKTEALRLLAGALKAIDGVELQLVLAGARAEEVSSWKETGVEPTASALLGGSLEGQIQAIERAVDQARRLAQRGTDAVVLIDSISELAPHVARRVLSAARNLVDGGSVTIIATAATPVGGETTVIAFDPARTSGARFDLAKSSTIRPDLLVGPEGAAAIAEAKAKAL
ncbi:MAG: Rho termination factor N-terminal domain-containing protein [Solirubrobacteraceae bacterium]|nr:Rho termination factor N-terminal domain-containing protein [Solirubrobacteraceae bacterium]